LDRVQQVDVRNGRTDILSFSILLSDIIFIIRTEVNTVVEGK